MESTTLSQSLPAPIPAKLVWHAEAVQNIPERRTRKPTMSTVTLAQIPGLKRVGTLHTPEGRILPWYSMDGFINTTEGWQLYCECRQAGDMSLYKNAKHAWEVLQK